MPLLVDEINDPVGTISTAACPDGLSTQASRTENRGSLSGAMPVNKAGISLATVELITGRGSYEGPDPDRHCGGGHCLFLRHRARARCK